MATDYPSARKVFGHFELDAEAGELRKHGVRLRISGQPLQILQILIECPGKVVTREELRKQIWADGTLVDFEHGLNAAMNKLRRALSDSAENSRYIETVPGRGYRFIGTMASAPTRAPEAGRLDMPRRQSLRASWWLISGAACLAAFAAGWLFHMPASTPQWKLVRLTSDDGYSGTPALSRDGKLLAYSSVSGLGDAQDLYLRHVGGGQPIRLTLDGTGNTMPDFSPDGSKIVFRSGRDGGGIYVISTFGGPARLLARAGFDPKYSPDGSQVAYWVGAQSVATSVPGSGAVWVVPAAGGVPRRVGAKLASARNPIWSPDGKYLLVVGYAAPTAFENAGIDWWVVAPDGHESVRTGAYRALRGAMMPITQTRLTPVPNIPIPGCWLADGNQVVFSRSSGDVADLWQVAVSPRTGAVSGLLRRLTTGSGNEVDPTCADGNVVFTSIETRQDIWLLPLDLNRGMFRGGMERIGEDRAVHKNPSLSGDRRYLAYLSDLFGPGNIRMRELATGQETSVAPSPLVQGYPVSNASGSRVAFSAYEKDKRVVYVSALGGVPERVCEGCLRATDWSVDEKSILVFGGNPYGVDNLDLASHQRTQLLRHPTHHIIYARFSPDGRWVSFTIRTDQNRGRIAVAPLDGQKPVPQESWVQVAEVSPDDYAQWSPDGQSLYFTSDVDGYSCVWGRRLDPVSRRPTGDIFSVHHFHGLLSFEHGGWSAKAGQIAVALVERTGNIWMMSH